MKLYAYTNLNNGLAQLSDDIVPQGPFAGRQFDAVFTVPIIETSEETKSKRALRLEAVEDTKRRVIEKATSGDVLFTSTLTNFSFDFITALSVVADLDQCSVRVMAFQEEFDSSQLMESAMLSSLPKMQMFKQNTLKAWHKGRIDGIWKAAGDGKFTGRPAYSLDDFPDFQDLYESCMIGTISKVEMAKKLRISRPTLYRLLEEYMDD